VGSAFFYEDLPRLKAAHPNMKVADLLFNPIGHTGNNRRYASFIDLNLVENKEVQQWLIEAGESPERIRLIPSGADLTINAPGAKDASLLAEYGIPADNIIVGFSGRWSEEKDPVGYVEIAKLIPQNLPITFVMTGAGPQETELRQAVHNSGLSPARFVVCGAVPEITPFLRLYDILALPSRVDGRPNVIMEAMANGAAVIASKVGALPDMLEDGVNGYLCNPGDYRQFAQRVVELASDATRLANFRREARSYAERHFDIQTMLVTYAQCFEMLVRS
jgi:glycosyltransferase involved in cell wall biosynthesis